MAEKSDVMKSLMANTRFRDRVRSIAILKAQSVLEEATPAANDLAWAKAVVAAGYDAWTEAVLILAETSPATINAATSAGDAAYYSALNTVFAEVVKAKS